MQHLPEGGDNFTRKHTHREQKNRNTDAFYQPHLFAAKSRRAGGSGKLTHIEKNCRFMREMRHQAAYNIICPTNWSVAKEKRGKKKRLVGRRKIERLIL